MVGVSVRKLLYEVYTPLVVGVCSYDKVPVGSDNFPKLEQGDRAESIPREPEEHAVSVIDMAKLPINLMLGHIQVADIEVISTRIHDQELVLVGQHLYRNCLPVRAACDAACQEHLLSVFQ